MSKEITTVSLDSELNKSFKEKYPNRNFTKFVEDCMRKEIGEKVSLIELDNKINDNLEELSFLEDKRDELLKMELQETLYKDKIKSKEIEDKLLEKQNRINDLIQKTKDIPEITEIINEVKSDLSKLNTRFLLTKSNELRVKYPALRIGITQLRDILIESTKN